MNPFIGYYTFFISIGIYFYDETFYFNIRRFDSYLLSNSGHNFLLMDDGRFLFVFGDLCGAAFLRGIFTKDFFGEAFGKEFFSKEFLARNF
jgi:hypothetical protein